jgi:hypothetical protein
VQGYPTVILLDSAGRRLGLIDGYEGETPQEYISKLKKLAAKAG